MKIKLIADRESYGNIEVNNADDIFTKTDLFNIPDSFEGKDPGREEYNEDENAYDEAKEKAAEIYNALLDEEVYDAECSGFLLVKVD